MNSALEWQFGGWLGGFAPPTAWSILSGLAVAGLVLVTWLYRRTLRDLSPATRWWLTGLRATLLLALLLCLANPTRVITAKPDRPDRRTLAVVVDRSDSMNTADQRGDSRLKTATRNWQRHLPEAKENFTQTTWWQFSTALTPADSLDAATQSQRPGPETHLFAALDEVLGQAPGAVVCLTDGLDTSGTDAQKLVSDAQRRGVPLYFVAGTNRLRTSDLLSIRDIRLPARVLRQSNFTVQTVLEIATPVAREIPAELWSGSTLLAKQTFQVRAGLNTFPWSVPVTAGEPGPLPLEFRLGTGPAQQMAGGTTQVLGSTKVDILYYQGALQWGYRFLLAALRGDESFRVTSIINPALGLRMSASTSSDLATLSDLPDTAEELKKYQIVVLAHVFANQLTDLQQKALVDYAKGGGGVLFIAPDASATARFAGTAVEQMLPVIFEPQQVETPEAIAARHFQEELRQMGVDRANDTLLENAEGRREPISRLLPFALPPDAGRSEISHLFSGNDPASLPHFNEYAPVRHVKPGAEILAVHPTECEADGRTPRVLLAREQFGSGFTAALTTDLLWRWKMSLPHESRAVEKFWQQLFLSLTPATGQGLRLVKDTESAAMQQAVTLRIEGASDQTAPKVVAIPPGGQPRALEAQRVADSTTPGWQVVVTPEIAGRWEVQASDAAGNKARMTLPVTMKTQTLETSNIPADVEGLRRLAESTGGALIEDDPVFQPRSGTIMPEERHSHPLWNTQGLLGLLLGLYGTELLVRRWKKLL